MYLKKVKTGFKGEFSGTIGDDVDVVVEFEINGQYHKATRNEPAEYPDIWICYVLIDGMDVRDCLNDKTLDQLTKDIDEDLQRYVE